jgi:hypothetical protein
MKRPREMQKVQGFANQKEIPMVSTPASRETRMAAPIERPRERPKVRSNGSSNGVRLNRCLLFFSSLKKSDSRDLRKQEKIQNIIRRIALRCVRTGTGTYVMKRYQQQEQQEPIPIASGNDLDRSMVTQGSIRIVPRPNHD